jgi:hypothetical protein
MPLWLDLLRTPMAAPETPSLRRMRLTWQTLCLTSALVVGLFRPFHRAVGQPAPLTAGFLLIVAVCWTVFYLVRKHRADTAILDVSGSAE